MRYHWGLGIGHVYSHEDGRFQQSSTIIDCEADCEGAGIQDTVNEDSADRQCQTRRSLKNACDSEFEDNDPELASGMGAPNDDDFSDGGSSDSDSEQDGDEIGRAHV